MPATREAMCMIKFNVPRTFFVNCRLVYGTKLNPVFPQG